MKKAISITPNFITVHMQFKILKAVTKNFSYKCFLLALIIYSNQVTAQSVQDPIQIAFLADIHLQDIYGSLSNSNFKGVLNPKNNKNVLIRTMESQLQSTRIYNENYFAFLAALDDIASRNIKIVALPGDYTDDGQPLHVRGLAKILKQYQDKHGISFFITTGNHDPSGPFAQESGKSDFMGQNGKNQAIFSQADLHKVNLEKEDPLVLSSDVMKLGYEGIMKELKSFGFYPSKNYIFWATPFSNYTTENYDFSKAENAATLHNRQYEIAKGYTIPDVSYLVEPVAGLWLLAIDGNVYIPKSDDGKNTTSSASYGEASTGYNNVLSHKAHLLKWIKSVSEQAKKQGKTLIAFSHFPMIDFNDDATNDLKELLGKNKWQLNRVPDDAVAEQFGDAGLKIHFGGHMHINDTGVRRSANGNQLVNVQTPSLAAYIPAYKLLTISSDSIATVETVTTDEVPRFNELFDLYEKEYQFLKNTGSKTVWNQDILKTKNYHEFTDFHLKELVRLRFMADWPKSFADFLSNTNGADLVILSQIKSSNDLEEIITNKKSKTAQWQEAEEKIAALIQSQNLNIEDFKKWKGTDLFTDFYRLRNADKLAIGDIGFEKIKQYKLLIDLYLTARNENNVNPQRHQLYLFLKIFNNFMNGAPADHFSVNLKSGAIDDLNK
ncbi:metallophosphoesterase [Flavobacterium frigidarium]|uniref:Metallophosphoesterase n=2 Tax=Flavobacterium TaxID=237 RepID=A0ABV4KGN2_9FLAO